jgi:hypothetical protein
LLFSPKRVLAVRLHIFSRKSVSTGLSGGEWVLKRPELRLGRLTLAHRTNAKDRRAFLNFRSRCQGRRSFALDSNTERSRDFPCDNSITSAICASREKR